VPARAYQSINEMASDEPGAPRHEIHVHRLIRDPFSGPLLSQSIGPTPDFRLHFGGKFVRARGEIASPGLVRRI
jgi:hypothetical protein